MLEKALVASQFMFDDEHYNQLPPQQQLEELDKRQICTFPSTGGIWRHLIDESVYWHNSCGDSKESF